MEIKYKITHENKNWFIKLVDIFLKGPVENQVFTVKLQFDCSNLKEDVSFFLAIHDKDYEFSSYDDHVVSIIKKKTRYDWDTKLHQGNYDVKIFMLGASAADRIIGECNEDLYFETSENSTYFTHKGTTIIPQGTPYISEHLKVHSISDVALLVLTIVSTIGAIFDVLSYFK